MNKKLSLSDLSDLLAESAKISKKEASAFIKTLFELTEEHLVTDKIVKIKGLGTFKLIRIETRRIANVNTGELQEIPEHYKTTFTPDEALAKTVNEPFAHLETMVLDDEIIADQPIETTIQLIEKSTSTETSEKSILSHKKESSAIVTEPSLEKPKDEKQEEVGEIAETQPSSSKPTNSRKGKRPLFFLVGLVLIAGATYFGYRFCKFTETPTPTSSKLPVVAQSDSVHQTHSDTATEKRDTIAKQTNEEPKITQERQSTQDVLLATEVMKKGSRLTLIALKYYGNKAFWVYLYLANKQVIQNPNKVAIGTIIEIPYPKSDLINANNPESVAKAKALEAEILSNQK